MKNTTFQAQVFWDAEAKVWVATSDDVTGLATEAPTIEALTEKLRVIIPELVDINAILPKNYVGNISFELISHRQELTEAAS